MRRADKPTTFMLPIDLKSGNLKLLEPSGPVQAYNGIAVPFYKAMTKRVLYLHFEMSVSCLNSSKEIVVTVIKDTPYKFVILSVISTA